MMTVDEKFAQTVPAALHGAVSIAWDECHKIYILQDENQHTEMQSYGYEPFLHRVEEIGEERALNMLRKWFDASCGLRFINSVRTVKGDPNEGFKNIIAQFECDEDEDEEDL